MQEATARKVKIDIKRKACGTDSTCCGSGLRSSNCCTDALPTPTTSGLTPMQITNGPDCSVMQNMSMFVSQSRRNPHVTFSNEVLVKIIPDCWDFLAGNDDNYGDNIDSRHLSSNNPGGQHTAAIIKTPLKGISNPFFLHPNIYKTMYKPIPERPIHPRLLKVALVTNASHTYPSTQTTGPCMSSEWTGGPASMSPQTSNNATNTPVEI